MKILNKILRTIHYFVQRAISQILSWHWSTNYIPSDKPIVVIDNPNYDFHRYLYLLTLLLTKSGYTVVIKPYPKRIARLRIDKHGKKIFNLKQVRFSNKTVSSIGDYTALTLSPRYFEQNSAYHIPIFQHPSMYELEIENWEPNSTKKEGFFFAGDFRNELYLQLDQYDEPHWNRIKLKATIDKIIQQNERLGTSIKIIDNSKAHLTPLAYRKALGSHRFLLALPGIHMPLCHNIAEALSMGVIPFLHSSYSAVFYPKLSHLKNAFIYNSFEEIEHAMQEALDLSNHRLESMSINAKELWQTEMSNEAIVTNVLNNNTDIRLLASWNSKI